MGIGASEGDTTQADFQAPGIPSKYRLGNEANTNIEVAFDYRFRLTDADDADAPYIQAFYMLKDFEFHGNTDELGPDHVVQAYISFSNIIAPGVSLTVAAASARRPWRCSWERDADTTADRYCASL